MAGLTYLWLARPATDEMLITLGLSDFRSRGTDRTVTKYGPAREDCLCRLVHKTLTIDVDAVRRCPVIAAVRLSLIATTYSSTCDSRS